ncbi:hypothetical protein [Belliella pelovolcani]|uniref:Preprotein translocase subunit SecB n=1 Tax=Belliella pelovolcani TaxID=529505 RepID=A0A1N7PM69_9BACT|nr:hypothetical protein [Belliella pelovolcani]SIT11688.1 hypothetical protein SAMN05421761_1182 [Belliella pelovolcani]
MFEIKKSPLQLLEFFLLENQFFVDSNGISSGDEIDAIFDSYPVSVDFAHHDGEGDEFQVFVIIDINKDRKKPGYSMYCTGMGIFKLPTEEIDVNSSVYKNLKLYSTVNMVINQLRNILSLQTAYAPHGRFNLPPIDIGDLFAKKSEATKSKKGSKK